MGRDTSRMLHNHVQPWSLPHVRTLLPFPPLPSGARAHFSRACAGVGRWVTVGQLDEKKKQLFIIITLGRWVTAGGQ